MLWVIVSKQPGVVRDMVVIDLEHIALCLDLSVPAYPLDYRHCAVVLVSGTYSLVRVLFEKLIDVWVFLVPLPPCSLVVHVLSSLFLGNSRHLDAVGHPVQLHSLVQLVLSSATVLAPT